MGALVSFFAVLFISLIIVRIFTVLLTLTGVSHESARFQVRSAFTGTGFTTSESEIVVRHPVRRQIIMILMLLRHAGFISVISSLLLSFLNTQGTSDVLIRLGILCAGLLAFYFLSKNKLFDYALTKIIERALNRFSSIRIADYESLLNLAEEYEVIEVQVKSNSWLANKRLEELHLPEEGVLILGIRSRDGAFVGAPRGNSYILTGDKVILYGKESAIREVDEREAGHLGNEQHKRKVREIREVEKIRKSGGRRK